MSRKVLVEIFVPVADESFDVYIPLESKMHEVLKMVSKLISSLTEGRYKAMDNAVLCDQETGIVYNINLPVAELGIQNGSRLILI